MKYIISFFFLLLFPIYGWADTQIASDDFNRANGGVGANWSSQNNWDCSGLNITGNEAEASHNSLTHACTVRWNGTGTFSNDQYSTATLTGTLVLGSGIMAGVKCRASADADTSGNNARDHYEYLVVDNTGTSSKQTLLQKVINGAITNLTTNTVTWVPGDIISIRCIGTTISGLKNSVQQTSATDSALTTGKPGLLSNDPAAEVDNWSGGDATASALDFFSRRRQ